MKLNTTYMGIALPHPLIIAAGPLTDDIGNVRQLEDNGAAALTLRSLFEEEIIGEQMSEFYESETHNDSFPEATNFSAGLDAPPGPYEYLEHLRRVKSAVSIPVIASLNGCTPGGWTSIAHLIEQAGADALELNLFHSASDASMSSADVERHMLEILRSVKKEIRIPVAVKLSPLLTAFANFSMQLDAAGADGIVLFTRFHKVDLDVEELEVIRSMELSTSADLDLRLRGTAVLSGRVKASLAITGGVHTALDVIKANMAGAHVMQLMSAILRHGPGHIKQLLADIDAWMLEHEWDSLNEMRGNMSFEHVADPGAYERENYRMMLR